MGGDAFGSDGKNPDSGNSLFFATSSMTTARANHTATLLNNGKVLIAGGEDNGSCFSSAEIYDPATGQFSPTNSMAAGRSVHTATLLPSTQALVVGGTSGSSSMASAEIYTP